MGPTITSTASCTLIVDEPNLHQNGQNLHSIGQNLHKNGQIQNGKLLLPVVHTAIKRDSMYAIPPPNYKFDPRGNFEILL